MSDPQPFISVENVGLNIGGYVTTGTIHLPKKNNGFVNKFDDVQAIWLQGAEFQTELAIGYSAVGGGASAIGFSRGGSWDTDIKFYTNAVGNAGTHNMVERMRITPEGNVGIGTAATGTNKLAVEGTIAARKVKVTAALTWPDYVFAKNYELPSIASVEKYIAEHQHLPGIPSAEEVKQEGIDLGNMDAKLLQKIEELTLYLIEMKKENEEMKARLKALESRK
ncbi:hypothetical protein [uncultured Chitinophaga sp.]|uniref:hypothetical protein n=1 Tax=uncultured Chitinophaga sp. TaxID=339340 RepID=UPI0025E7E44C|nr:hypothetical protein [uncultured Chitinophaga sp.]